MTVKKASRRKTALSQRGPGEAASTWIQVHRGKRNLAGARIRRIRDEKEITQTELMGKLARHHVVMTQVTIAKLESGTRAIFDYEIVAFSKALGVPVTDLIS